MGENSKPLVVWLNWNRRDVLPLTPCVFLAVLGIQAQGRRVQAVPKPGRLGAVGKDVPQVGVTDVAEDLGSAHEEAPVDLRSTSASLCRVPSGGARM